MRDVTKDLFLSYVFSYPGQRNPNIIKFLFTKTIWQIYFPELLTNGNVVFHSNTYIIAGILKLVKQIVNYITTMIGMNET